MVNKKMLAVTALALLLSQQSFAERTKGFYLGGKYNSQFLNSTDVLKIVDPEKNIDKVTISERDTKKTGQKLSNYMLDYNTSFTTNFAFGYAGEFENHNYRAELEGMYSSVKVDNTGLANSKLVIAYVKKVTDDSTAEDKKYLYGTVINHNNVENAFVMVNAYHYWETSRFSFSPYAGVGIGVTRMKMWDKESMGPAYQIKTGLDYCMTEDICVNVGYRHFGAIGLNFQLETRVAETEQSDKGSSISEKINIGSRLFYIHGIEVGLTIHFV